MATVEDDKQGAVGRQVGDKVLVQDVAVDLAAGFEVVGDDGIEEAGRALAGGVADLAAWEERQISRGIGERGLGGSVDGWGGRRERRGGRTVAGVVEEVAGTSQSSV